MFCCGRWPRSRSAIDQNADKWAYSSVGLERTPDKREVGSSNLPRPTSDLIERRGWRNGKCSGLGSQSSIFKSRTDQVHQSDGAVAQLGEHLLCKQGVVGSIPISSTNAGSMMSPAGSAWL